MLIRFVLACLTALLLIGCSYDDVKESLIPKAESTFAEHYLAQWRGKNFDYVTSHMHPQLQSKVDNNVFEKIASYLAAGELVSTELMGSQVKTLNKVWTGTFSFEYQFDNGWAVASVSMVKVDDKLLVKTVNFRQTPDSQKNINAFSKVDITALKVLTLFLTIIIPLFMIVTCIWVYKSPIENKVRWYFLSLVGIGSFSINWTTGDFYTHLAAIKLLGFGITAGSEFAPFIVKFTLPVGAAAFWIRRKSLMNKAMSNRNETIVE